MTSIQPAERVTEYGSAFFETGAYYKTHRNQDEAQQFVDGMNEVGASMMVVAREMIPAVYGEWSALKGAGDE